MRFDLDALCNAAATAGGDPSRVTAIEKMEGGFSKALLMKRADGTEVIAKIPCRIAGPPSLTTAGEVGVLEYGTWLVRKESRVAKTMNDVQSGDTLAFQSLVSFHGHRIARTRPAPNT